MNHALEDDEARALAPSWLSTPVLGPWPRPAQQRLLSCFDWHVLKAPWVFVFTRFGLFFSFNSGARFHAGYQIDVAGSDSVCGSQLLCPCGLFRVSPLPTQGGAAC